LSDVTVDVGTSTISWELVGDQSPLDVIVIDVGEGNAGRPEWRLFAPGDWTEVELPALPSDVERVFPDLDAGADVVMFDSSNWPDYAEMHQNVDFVYEGYDTVVTDNITWFSAFRREPEHPTFSRNSVDARPMH
jgi:hypothetical protein